MDPYQLQLQGLIYLTSIKKRDKANQSEPLFDIEVLVEASAMTVLRLIDHDLA